MSVADPFADDDDDLGRQAGRAVRELPDVPAALERAAIGLFSARAPVASPREAARALWHEVVAVLSFDSWATPALASGMRSLRSPTRHLLYSAEGRDIDLRVASAAAASFSLSGQILGPDEQGRIELEPISSGVGPTRRAELDSLGEFRIDDIPRGVYRLSLEVSGERIVLPPLDMGDPPR